MHDQIILTEDIARKILSFAKKNGASDAETHVALESGFNVTVRMGAVETVEYHDNHVVAITCYFGKRKAHVITSDISEKAIKSAVTKACEMAKFVEEDPYAGLADKKRMAKKLYDLNQFHVWTIDSKQAIELALTCENQGRNLDPRIKNSEGVSISSYKTFETYSNTHGFVGSVPSTRHNISCILIAEENGQMERDYYYSTARDPKILENIEVISKKAANKTVRRLNPQKIKTQKVPVVFSAEIASGLLGAFIAAISGNNLYRKNSFLVDHLGKQIFSKVINMDERPHLFNSYAGTLFDVEGVATTAKFFVKKGILESYALGSYAARKLGMQTTANADGVHNLFIRASDLNFKALLKKMGKGILVTELIGQGINLVTGDYSRGAIGFWVDNGEIQYPVSEITIAGNLREMFLNLITVGNDIDQRGNIQTGSILLEGMTVGGN